MSGIVQLQNLVPRVVTPKKRLVGYYGNFIKKSKLLSKKFNV